MSEKCSSGTKKKPQTNKETNKQTTKIQTNTLRFPLSHDIWQIANVSCLNCLELTQAFLWFWLFLNGALEFIAPKVRKIWKLKGNPELNNVKSYTYVLVEKYGLDFVLCICRKNHTKKKTPSAENKYHAFLSYF